MNATHYSKSVLLAAATNTVLVEVFINRTLHESWVHEDNTVRPHTTEGGLFQTIDLVTGLTTAERRFETAAEAEEALTSLVEFEGYRVVTETEAEAIMLAAPLPTLPEPPAGMMPGTYAYTAWLMAQTGIMTGDEADAWKDEMKMKEGSWS